MDEALSTFCNGLLRTAGSHKSRFILEDVDDRIAKLGTVISYIIDELGMESAIERSARGALTIAQRSVR